jgi:MerR family mercuric resistance operon transcriptional regulator
MDQSQELLWKIGQVADRTGVSVDTVRYYERRGLVTPAHRAGSGYRYYRPDVVDRILLARRLQALGMTLDEVAQALQAHDIHGGTCASQRWRLEAARDRIATQLDELTAVLHDVDATLANCASGSCTLTGHLADQPANPSVRQDAHATARLRTNLSQVGPG